MDIAKIRKKVKEAAGQESGRPREEQVTVSHKVDDTDIPEVPSGTVTTSEKAEIKDRETSGEGTGAMVQLLAFRLASEEYAFRIDEIEEIVKPQKITVIPNTEPYLLGITSLRGKIIPVVDLRKMLSLDGVAEGGYRKRKILILKGPKGAVGALIDRVMGVIRLSALGIVETPPHLPEAQMKFIEGVAVVDGRFISVLRLGEAVAI